MPQARKEAPLVNNRRANAGLLRQKILDEAIGTIYREGVDRVTMRALAEKLGYSPATIYLHFKNKEDLINEIAHYGFLRLEEIAHPVLEIDDPLEAVSEGARRYVDFGLRNSELYRLMFREFSPSVYATRATDRTDELWALYRKLFQRGMERGVFRSGDPDVEIAMLWAACHGFVELTLSERMPPRQTPGAALDAMREALVGDRLRALRP